MLNHLQCDQFPHPVGAAPTESGYSGVCAAFSHLQKLVSRGVFEHALAGAVAQYVLVETEVVMPAGQELEGMQKVSTVDAPGSEVMLYH